MIRPSSPNFSQSVRYAIDLAASAACVALLAGCALPAQAPSGPTAAEIAKQQRLDRAQAKVSEALKKYDSGSYDEAISNFLLALDSGQLTIAEQLTARKHMAFIHCLGGREANCKEEFEKAISLDPKFDLSPAEAGHPTWGPVHRLARMESELRRAGRAVPVAPRPVTVGEKMLQDAIKAYDDADYKQAIKVFQDALKESLTPPDQLTAHKFLAFSYCLSNRMTLCRAEFEAMFKIDANFDLGQAEAGHPSWGPSFRAAKAKQKPVPPKKP